MAELKKGPYLVDLMWKGSGPRRTITAEVDPTNPKAMRELLLAEMKKFRGDKEPFIQNYELRLRRPGSTPTRSNVLLTFAAVK